MLRVLALSTLFPRAEHPYVGNFIERQLMGLADRSGVAATVVAPVLGEDRPEGPGGVEKRGGLDVARPALATAGLAAEDLPGALADAVRPVAVELRRRGGLDVLAAELLWPDGPAVAELARALGLPFSIKVRGHELERLERNPALLEQARAAARQAGLILSVSSALRERLGEAGFPPERIVVHYTGVDHEQFRLRDRASLKAGLKIAGPLLLAVGSLVPRKRHHLAIEALAHLPGCTLLIAGGGPEAEVLQARIDDLGLGERARLLGHVPHLMLPGLLGAADATVLASASEGLANVWVESLACGTPVVTTDADGAREAIDRPEAGRIVAAEPAAIAAGVAELLADAADPRLISAAAERFSWQRNAEELERYLRAVAFGA